MKMMLFLLNFIFYVSYVSGFYSEEDVVEVSYPGNHICKFNPTYVQGNTIFISNRQINRFVRNCKYMMRRRAKMYKKPRLLPPKWPTDSPRFSRYKKSGDSNSLFVDQLENPGYLDKLIGIHRNRRAVASSTEQCKKCEIFKISKYFV